MVTFTDEESIEIIKKLLAYNVMLESAQEPIPQADNSASNKLRARLSQMEVIVKNGCTYKQELLNLIDECTQLLA